MADETPTWPIGTIGPVLAGVIAFTGAGKAIAAEDPAAERLANLPPLIDRQLFFGDPEISGAQLSPDGKWISFRKPYQGVMNVWVKAVDEPFDAAKPLTADTKRPLGGHFWTEDSRYVLFVQDEGGTEDYHVYAVDPAAAPIEATGVPPARDLTPMEGIRALIYEVEKTPTGLQIILSRTHTQFVRKIFELEVPEIYDGTIEIYKMVREPGYRTKMAVYSTRDDVDPVGACVGMRGARIQAVVRELEGEKIDVLKYDPDPAVFIRNALQPAEVEEVIIVDDATRHALAVVHDAQFSLAIGRQGLNVRLANRLVDWNIDVKTRAQVADMDLGGEKKREAAALFSEDEAQEIDRISELPGVPERIAAALAEQGIERIEDLVEMSDDQLAATRGLTSEDISTIRNLLDETVEIVEEDEVDQIEQVEQVDESPPPADQADVPVAEAEPDGDVAADVDVVEEVEEITAVSELGLEQRVTDALAASGVQEAEALMSMSEAELAGVPGLSPDDVAGIRQLLEENVVIIEEPPEGDE